jgi:peroxiredoxin Q/BCP
MKKTGTPILEKPYRAPAIAGFDAMRTKISQDSFDGKWVVLYFYPKDMTPGCTTQAGDFQRMAEEFEDLNAVIVGVSKDSCEKHQKFADKEGLRFLLISDEFGRLCDEYGVWKEKSMYGRNFMGIERTTFLINPQGEIVALWPKVKVTNHVVEVLETLKECKKRAIRQPRG